MPVNRRVFRKYFAYVDFLVFFQKRQMISHESMLPIEKKELTRINNIYHITLFYCFLVHIHVSLTI